MENLKNYFWTTEFRTSENLMIHTFTDRIKVVSNIKTGAVKVLKDGEVIRTTENPAIADYERLLSQVAEDANKLERFKAEE